MDVNRYFCVGSEDEFHKCLKEAASEETAKERRRTAYRMNIGDNSTMTDVEDWNRLVSGEEKEDSKKG